jgi:hypothetical protein
VDATGGAVAAFSATAAAAWRRRCGGGSAVVARSATAVAAWWRRGGSAVAALNVTLAN